MFTESSTECSMSSQRNLGLERTLLALFVASGFAGLIYQAIWSHYLGLTLGHAAYAQTLVLGIFMGGMALGAWLISRFGVQWRRLILAYAIVEVLIGIGGLGFHFLFEAYTEFSQQTVYPALSSVTAVRAWQWGSAALLIAPQSILLGMTFPLMSGGYLRVAPRADGEILGGLYFTNSIGAAFGALFSTFVLLPRIGMPGAVATAGVVNLAVGVLAWLVSRRAYVQSTAKESDVAAASPVSVADGKFFRMMLIAATITGGSSFVYEIGWVRMLNQALGTTIHSFELMLSAFILGLAFGGWWIRKRSRLIADPVSYAGYAQIWMGIAALISIPVFGQSFRWVGAMMASLPKTDDGYTLFSIGSAAIALAVMFPAAFFAGMTLPLITMAMLRRSGGEASIGRVYAANTLGAILGVVMAVHVLIPLLGLRLAVTVAALADIALGIVLLRLFTDGVRQRTYLGAVAAALVVIAGSLLFGKLDPRTLASGVFRSGAAALGEGAEVLYLRDGKTATVSFTVTGSVGTIATNGKPDASIQLLPDVAASDDEITMVMAAALPLTVHPNPLNVAVIGWGSGLSTHTLMGSSKLTQVDSIEIEHAMYEGASLYRNRVARGYTDPRSKVHIDDARTFFSSGKRQYDVIVSEPSNPWVSGVASLFTQQFYRFMRGHLNDNGVVVQWLQSYELSDELLATMLAALISEFPHVDAYVTNSADLLFLASDKPLQQLDISRIQDIDLRNEMIRVGLGSDGDFNVRKIGSRAMLQAVVAMYGAEPHSDYFPEVSLNAPRARFKGESVQSLGSLMALGMPVLEIAGGRKPSSIADEVILTRAFTTMDYWNARDTKTFVLEGSSPALLERQGQLAEQSLIQKLTELRRISAADEPEAELNAWLLAAAVAADFTIGYLPAEDLHGLWIDPEWIGVADQSETVKAVLAAYAAAARRDGAAMYTHGLAALALLDESRPSISREHMLVIAMLGAIADGKPAQVTALEHMHSANLPATTKGYGLARAYLQAWVEVIEDE
jgi:spermidine synthase